MSGFPAIWPRIPISRNRRMPHPVRITGPEVRRSAGPAARQCGTSRRRRRRTADHRPIDHEVQVLRELRVVRERHRVAGAALAYRVEEEQVRARGDGGEEVGDIRPVPARIRTAGVRSASRAACERRPRGRGCRAGPRGRETQGRFDAPSSETKNRKPVAVINGPKLFSGRRHQATTSGADETPADRQREGRLDATLVDVVAGEDRVGRERAEQHTRETDRDQRLAQAVQLRSRAQKRQDGEDPPVVLRAGVRSSFEKIDVTCFSTARSVTTSSSAIAAFDRPSAISPRTSRSRGEIASSGSSRRCRPTS